MFNFFGAPFQAQSEEKQEGAVAPPRPKSPPKYYEEWVTSKAAQHLITPARPASLSSSESHADDQWPVHDPEHGVLVGGDSDKGDLLLGTLEDIKTDLQKHAPWDGAFLDNVDKQLQELEKTLDYFADRFICERDPDSGESTAGGLKNINNITFLTELKDVDLVNSRNIHSSNFGLKSGIRNVHIQEQEKDIMTLSFPGFGNSTVVQLPGKLEALPILDLVTKAQHFRGYVARAWRKLFYSDASTALFQNIFWWIWMDQFKPNTEQQAHLFDTIADFFVTNLMNMNEKHKDEVFVHYPGCLSQALYCTFCKAFPKSNKYFSSSKFLSYINDLMSEWIAGVKSAPDAWEKWPLKVLNPNYSFSSESKLDSRPGTFSERELLSKIEQSPSNQQPNGRKQSSRVQLLRSSTHEQERIQSAVMSAKRNASLVTCTEERADKKQSLSNITVGPGPIFECVRFNTLGRSPLLQHYLLIHGLTDVDLFSGSDVSWTQVKEIPATTITYDELIRKTTEISAEKYKVYEKKLAETGMAINAVHKKHAADMRRMEKQNKRVLQHRHEVAILAEKLVANRRKTQLPPISKASQTKKKT